MKHLIIKTLRRQSMGAVNRLPNNIGKTRPKADNKIMRISKAIIFLSSTDMDKAGKSTMMEDMPRVMDSMPPTHFGRHNKTDGLFHVRMKAGIVPLPPHIRRKTDIALLRTPSIHLHRRQRKRGLTAYSIFSTSRAWISTATLLL